TAIEPASRLSVVQAAGQLPDDQEIHPGEPFRPERRTAGQGRHRGDRPQGGEHAEGATEAEQAGLGPERAWSAVEGRGSYGAEQDGRRTGTQNGGAGWRREGIIVSPNGRRADERLLDAEREPEAGGNRGKNLDGGTGDFGTDAVAGKADD